MVITNRVAASEKRSFRHAASDLYVALIFVPGKLASYTLICSSITGLKDSSTLICIVPLAGESVTETNF